MDTIAPGLTPTTRPVAQAGLLARNWWLVALRGVFALAFAAYALLAPAVALESLVLVLAIYLLADGAAGLASGVYAATHHQRWAWLLVEGVAGIAAGLVALAMPGITVLFVVTLLGAWAIVSGVTLLIAAFRLPAGHGGAWMGIGAVASIIWGGLLFAFPIQGAIVLTIWIGIYAAVFGVTMLVLAARLRSRHAGPTMTITPASAA